MNINKSYKMMPILIGLSSNYAIANTELLFSESNIIKDNFINVSKETILAQRELKITSNEFNKFKFEEFYQQWQNNTFFSSNPKMIIEDENFQKIIQMGENAIPFILNKIKKEPSVLVWALNIITNKKVSNKENITISDACKLWVKSFR